MTIAALEKFKLEILSLRIWNGSLKDILEDLKKMTTVRQILMLTIKRNYMTKCSLSRVSSILYLK